MLIKWQDAMTQINNAEKQVVILEGWPASGKTSLWALLDGSDEIFVEPLHTFWYEIIFDLFADENDFRPITVRELRCALSKTEYYKTEQYANAGKFPISFAADKQKDHEFEFNFYKFDQELIEAVCDGSAKSAKDLVEIFTTLYLQNYGASCANHKYKYIVSMSNYFMYKKNAIDKYKSIFKVIAVARPPIEIYASRISRTPRVEDGNKTSDFAPNRKKLAIEAELEECFVFYEYWRELANRSPQHVLSCSLNEVLSNKYKAMNKIMDFLNLTCSEINYYGTRDGEEIEDAVYSLTKSTNDDSNYLLSHKDKTHALVRMTLVKLHKQPVNILNMKSIIRFLYLRMKKLR